MQPSPHHDPTCSRRAACRAAVNSLLSPVSHHHFSQGFTGLLHDRTSHPRLSSTLTQASPIQAQDRNKPPGACPPSSSPGVPRGGSWVPPSASELPRWPTMLCVCCAPCSCARLCCWRAALGWARPALWERSHVLQVGWFLGLLQGL